MPTRRALLGRIGLAVATAGLAGCGTTESRSRSPADGEGSPGAGNGGNPGTGSNPYEANGRSVVERFRHAVRATPVVAGETLYVVTNGSGLYALDLASGTVQWRVETGGTPAAPRVVDDVVYTGDLGAGETPEEIVRSDGTAYAVDRHTGETLWETTLAGSLVHTPVVREETVYYGAQLHGIHALDAGSGEPRWDLELGSTGAYGGGLVVRDGVAYTAGRRRVVAVDLAARERSWEAVVGPRPRGVTLDGDRLYAGVDSGLVALRADTGETVWTADGSPATGPIVGSILVAGTIVDRGVVAVDPATGDERWTASLPGIPVRPILDGETFYVSTYAGTVHALDPDDGTSQSTISVGDGPESATAAVAGTATTPRELRCTPALHDGVLYVGRDDGTVFAVDVGSSRTEWRTSLPDAA